MSLIETWKKVFDREGYGGAVLMDLSKAFDTVHYHLLLAKFWGAARNFLESASKSAKISAEENFGLWNG